MKTSNWKAAFELKMDQVCQWLLTLRYQWNPRAIYFSNHCTCPNANLIFIYCSSINELSVIITCHVCTLTAWAFGKIQGIVHSFLWTLASLLGKRIDVCISFHCSNREWIFLHQFHFYCHWRLKLCRHQMGNLLTLPGSSSLEWFNNWKYVLTLRFFAALCFSPSKCGDGGTSLVTIRDNWQSPFRSN